MRRKAGRWVLCIELDRKPSDRWVREVMWSSAVVNCPGVKSAVLVGPARKAKAKRKGRGK